MMKKVRSFLCIAIALILFAASLPIADFAIDAKATNRRNVINIHNISGSDIVAQARNYLGVPYDTSGGNYQYRTGYGSTMMFDCSGFVFRVCKDVGLTSNVANYSEGKDINGNYYLTAHTQEQRYYGTDISSSLQKYINTGDFSELKAGDLLFLTSNNSSVSHVAIYSGSGTIIHSEGWAGCVSEHPIGRYPTSNNWYFAACRLITSNNTTNSEEKKLTKSSYPSHCTIKVTENDKNIMSLPCSNKTNSKSDKVETAPKGSTYEAIGLILNTEDNLWYKVKAKNGKEGYIFAGNVSFVSTITSDITGPGISVPSNHTQGKTYVLTGSVNSSYNELTNVSAYVYSGSNKITGGTESANGKSYPLGRSAIDNQTEFNKLAVGQYTYKVTASYKSYYAKTDKTYGTKTGTVNVYSQAFNVVSGSVSPTVPQQPTTIIYPNNGGIYKIAYGGGNNMYLDFAVTSDNVQIYENCDGHSNPDFVKSQYFKFNHVSDGWYTIINVANGKCADITNTDPTPGTNIMQWECYPNDGQLYRFYDAGNGYCYIKSKLGTYVDVANAENANNANVWAYSFNGSIAQKWKLEVHSHFYSSSVTTETTCTQEGVKTYFCSCGHSYTEAIARLAHTNVNNDNKCDMCGYVFFDEPSEIILPECDGVIFKIASAVGKDKYLDFDYTSPNVQILTDSDGHSDPGFVKSQYFTITHVGDGWYSITNIDDNLSADVAGANPSLGTNVQQCPYVGNDAQLFRFYDAGDGYCYVKSKLGCYLDVENGIDADNTNVHMYGFNATNAQKWKLVVHSHSYSSVVTTEATCLQEGIRSYTCNGCLATYTESIPKGDHSYGDWSVIKAASCSTAGRQQRNCTRCNAPQTREIAINTSAHKWDNGAITTIATCKVSGVKTYTCQHNSDHKKTESLGINVSNHVNTKTVAEVKATCTKVGYTAGVYCNDCQKYISGHKEIPVLMNNIGDVDGDGQITSSDARLALRAAVGLDVLSDAQKKTSDADSDGQVTSSDARLILRAAVGLEELKKRSK